MESKCIVRETAVDRDARYSKFYSEIFQNYFQVTEEFFSKVEKISAHGETFFKTDQVTGDLECHQFAFMRMFAVCLSSLSQQKFYESLFKCEEIARSLANKTRINICCVGKHGVFSVIGLCKVIEECVKQLGFQDDDPTPVRIFIIEKNQTWKCLTKYIVDSAKEKFPRLKLKVDQVSGDLAKNFSDDVKTALEKSHIVTSVDHSSCIPGKKIFPKIIKNTLTNMKKNAVLFYLLLDYQVHQLNQLKELISNNASFREILSSKAPVKYVLDEKTKFILSDLKRNISSINMQGKKTVDSVMFSTWAKTPKIKVQNADKTASKPELNLNNEQELATGEKKGTVSAKDKKSSYTFRNTDKKFKLNGKFAYKDMEKKNKDDSKRQSAREAAASRYANFVDDDY